MAREGLLVSRAPDSEPLPTPERSSIADAAVVGARSYAGSRAIIEVVGFASTIVLARLIAPAQFGYAAIALIVPQVAEILAYEGFGSYLVRQKNATWGDARAVTGLSLATCLTATAIVLACAPLLRGLVGGPAVGLMQVASIAFCLAGPGIVPLALLQRQLDFPTLGKIEARSAVVNVVVSVALAALGAGAYALIIGALSRRAYSAVHAQLSVPLVRPTLQLRRSRDVLSFGSFSALAGLLWIAKQNVDYVIISARLSPTDLGYYYRAYALGIQYQQKIGLVLMKIAFPSYARSTDIADMFRIRKRFARAQMSLVIPFLGTFVAAAPLLIPVVFGERWSPSVVPAQILTVTAAVGLITNGTAPMLLAASHARDIALSNLASFAGYGLTVYVLAPHGLIAVCIGVSAYNVLFDVLQSYLLLTRKMGMRSRDLFTELLQPAICIAPVIALTAVTSSIDPRPLAALGLLVLLAAVAAVSYVGLLRLLFPANWSDLADMARRFRGRNSAPATL